MKNRAYSLAFALAAITLSSSSAFAHDEKPKDPSIWDKSISFSFNYSSGNTDNLFLNTNAKAGRDYESNIWAFELDGNYGESDDDDDSTSSTDSGKQKTEEDFTADAEYKRLITDRVYLGFGTKYRYDEVADLDYRVTLKPVVGYFWIKDDVVRFSTDVGPAYVFERVGSEEDDFFAPRVSDKFEWKISETSKVFQSAEYLFDVSDTDNYVVTAEAGINAALNSWLSLELKIKNEYDNTPAKDKERNDFSLLSGLRFSL